MKSLSVSLKNINERSYPIHIAQGLLKNQHVLLEELNTIKAGRQIAIISNQNVAQHYLAAIEESLSEYEILSILLPEGEAHKNIASMEFIYTKLSEAGFNRSSTLIALGGGVIGDITGFVAATWMRGVNYIQIPTTLLAQVDSSVGGKTGVNIPQGKNMIGCFYHPRSVFIDLDTLSTLPSREFKAGLAEVIKYGLIYDKNFFRWLQQNMAGILAYEPALLAYMVEHSCSIKAQVVAEDEKEHGLRAILNLGHTFGHAIETAMGYGEWLHGEAIAAGMVYAAKLSYELGWIKQEDVDDIIVIFQAADLPTLGPDTLRYDDYWQLMIKDKKSRDKGLPLVLLTSIGNAVVSYDYQGAQVEKVLSRTYE